MIDKEKNRYIWGTFPMNKPTPNQPSTKEPKNEIKLTPIKSTSPILDKAIKEHIPYPVPKQNDKPNEPVVGEFQLSVSIPTFQKRVVGTENVIFYKIDLFSALSNQSWTVYHKINDFVDLNFVFNKFFMNPPRTFNLVQQNMFDKNIQNAPENHKKLIGILNQFLNDIINRPDLLCSAYTVAFLKLENHYPNITIFKPLELFLLKDDDDITFPITCSAFHKEANLLFIGMGKPQGTVVSSFFNKVGNFFKSPQAVKNIRDGKLAIYNIIKNHGGEHMFILLNSQELEGEVNAIHFFKEKNALCVGMKNGHINMYKIYINESSSETKDFIEFAGVIKAHSSPVLGFAINFEFGYIYTFAKEINLKISELNYQSLMKTVPITRQKVSAVNVDFSYERVILCDEGGSIYIVDVLTDPLIPKIVQMIHNQLFNVTCLKSFPDKNLFCVGNQFGMLSIYTMRDIEIVKEKDINLYSRIEITDVIINLKNEIYISTDNGSIAVYIHDSQCPDYVLDFHLRKVSSIEWDEDKKSIISCSEDKSVKMSQVPLSWPSELLRKTKTVNSKNIIGDILNNRGIGGYSIKNNLSYQEGDYVVIQDEGDDISERQKYSEDLDGWSTEG